MKWDGKIFSLHSDDDGVVLFDTKKDAQQTRRKWMTAGANNVGAITEHDFSDRLSEVPTVIVEMEGGLVQECYANSDRVRLEIIDHDCHPQSKYAPEAETDEELNERWNETLASVKDLVPYDAEHNEFDFAAGGFVFDPQDRQKNLLPEVETWMAILKEQTEFFLESHREELNSKHGGDSEKNGEDPDGCSYCRSIGRAREILAAMGLTVDEI